MGNCLRLQFLFLAGDVLPLLILALFQQTPRMQRFFVFTHFTDDSFVFFYSVQTPVPTPLDANSGVTFATFLLPLSPFIASGLGPLSLNSTSHAFSPLPLLKYCCTLQLGPFPPLHPPLPPVHLNTACTASSDALPYPSSNVSSPPVPAAMPICIGALVSIFFTVDAECVVTLSMMTFSSAMSKSSFGNWSHRIDSSANSQALSFSLLECFLRLGLSQTFLRTCSSR